jgi:heat-inducible transcriptional repressor
MIFEDLTEREKGVLQALMNLYVATAEPVGSKAIATRYKLGVSPATIRNTLKNLEEMGLIQKPHTSAGRIPTDKGYRVFVDDLLKPEGLTESEEKKIHEEMIPDYGAVEELMEQASRVLGHISKQLGVTLAPRFDQGILTNIDLIPVAEKKLLVVLAIKSGLVRSVLLEVDSGLKTLALNRSKSILNERLCGLTLGEIKDSIDERLKETSAGDARLIKLFLNSSTSLLNFDQTEQLHLGGTTNIVNQPEFKNEERLSSFIELLEQKKTLIELLAAKGVNEGITITIGKEMDRGEIQSCSLVTSSYKTGDVKGIVGIIGPKRMRYAKLVSLVDYTAKLLSQILSKE